MSPMLLGIGLTLVKRLAGLHGGTVSARSDGPGRGAEFVVRLPTIRVPRVPATTAPTPLADAAPSRRIVVVEDNDDAREALVALLQADGHDVRGARTGEDGIECVLRERPDIALVDVGLPGIDGYEVARRIRASEHAPTVRLVAVTGYGQPEDVRRACEAGFDEHIVKPVAREALDRVLACPEPGRAPGR